MDVDFALGELDELMLDIDNAASSGMYTPVKVNSLSESRVDGIFGG